MDNDFRYDSLTGDVIGSDGEKIGGIGTLYTDDNTGRPSWVTVKTGLFGTKETFVPLHEATAEGNDLRVPYTKDQVKDAPNMDADEHLSAEEERRLYAHYERDYNAGYETDAVYADRDRVADVDVDRDRDHKLVEGGDSMVRREEELHVSKEADRREVGEARLRKYTVTEHQTVEVPVTREEVRVVREPLNETDRAGRITDGEDEASVTLYEERPVVTTETVAKERIGLEKERVQGTERVEADLKKERIETEGTEVRADRDGDFLEGEARHDGERRLDNLDGGKDKDGLL